jgi:peroxiredoxin
MPVAISETAKLTAYGTAGVVSLLLAGHFAASLPDAIERGREGMRRTREAPCQVLRPAPRNPVLGKLPVRAPDFTLKNHDGQEVRLSSLRGRVVLVNFWATWCSTCVVEMPSLEKLAKSMQDKPFTLLAVSVDENWDVVRQFFPEGSAMSVVLDKDKSVPARYGTEKFPESFLIDAEGNVRYYVISERQIWHTGEVQKCIEALLE